MALLFLGAGACFSALAADKSGVTPTAISLPAGPGSIEGLGESFQPTLNTGTAKYSVPLTIPPGTAGHAPELALRYDGGGANGPLGFGWSLGLPCIKRQTDKGIPRYLDAPNGADDDRDGDTDEPDELDTFITDAGEELVPQANGDYFCKIETSFIRYRRSGQGWEGALPTGVKMIFGASDAGRIEGPDGVYTWLLEKLIDTHGNVVTFAYAAFPGNANTNQKYIAGISYGPGAPPWTHFHFAAFAYEDRPDWFEDCRAGFPIRTGKRLKTITVGTQGPALSGHAQGDYNGDGTTDNLVRICRLAYTAHPHWSLLSRLTLIGADGVTALPQSTFDYTVYDPPDLLSASGHIIGGIQEPAAVMDNALVDLIDLNGDALPDVLRTELGGGAHTAYLNRGETGTPADWSLQWTAGADVASDDLLAWGVDLESSTKVAHLADMDGDGLSDLVHQSGPGGDVYYFPNTGQTRWGARKLMSVEDMVPPSPFSDPSVRTADLDFDKRMDVVQSIGLGEYRVWFNLGNQQYSSSFVVGEGDLPEFSLSGVDIVDFNGDRVPDIIRIRPGGVEVWTGLGYGRFLPKITVSVPDDDDVTDELRLRARLRDVTGDGLADFVIERMPSGQLWYWLNLGNYTLDKRRIITGMPVPVGIQPGIRWADMNGNGTTDLVYADHEQEPRIQTVDIGRLMGCVPRPNVLTRISNGIGRVVNIEYASSAEFALADAASGSPWPDPMPFPVSVVSGMRTGDSLGNEYLTQFAYHQGYYDGGEKEFRGFARVEQTEPGDPSAPTLVTRHVFDTGRTSEAMKGRLLRQVATPAGKAVTDPFWEETTAWTTRVLHTGTDGRPVVFAFAASKQRRIAELGQGVERVLEYGYEYDNYGNEIVSAEYGIVEGANRGAFHDERITATTFAYDLEHWLLRYPARQEARDLAGNVIARTETYYDDPTFAGGNFGVVTAGSPTLVRRWVTPSNPDDFVPSQRFQYDAYGNAITILDPLAEAPGGVIQPNSGHFRSVGYDGQFHAFPVSETIHLEGGKPDLVVSAAYDAGFGTVISSTDFNGHATTYGYDGLGRLTSIVRPGDVEAYPTVEYKYALAQPFGVAGLVNFIETRRLDRAPGSVGDKPGHYLLSRKFVDGLGRDLMLKAEAEPDPGTAKPRVAVTGAVRFNARRERASVLHPFYSLIANDNLEALLAYEDIGAPGWQGAFHVNGALANLALVAAHKTTAHYDALLRQTRVVNPDGAERREVREPLLTKWFDENDAAPASSFRDTPLVHRLDGLGRLVTVEEVVRLNDDGTAAGGLKTWLTAYEYRADDALTKITDAQGNQKPMTYDGLRRKKTMNDPDRGVLECSYDQGSNLVETVDAKGQHIRYTFDGANRLLTEDYVDEGLPFSFNRNPDVAYHYDVPAGPIDLGDTSAGVAANTKGMLAYVTDLSGEEHDSYDARGRVAWAVKRVPDPLNGVMVSYQTQVTHDALDRIVDLTYPDGDHCTYQYNERGLVEAITGGASMNNGGVPFVVSQAQYGPSGQLTQCAYGNGVVQVSAYDPRLRLAKLDVTPGSAPTDPLLSYRYAFDPASNVTRIDDLRPGASHPEGDARRNTQVFEYDDLYRLTRAAYSLNLPGEPLRDDGLITLRHDRIGNLLFQSSTISALEAGTPVADLGALGYGGAAGASNRVGKGANPGPHAVTSIQKGGQTRSFSYDGNGNAAQRDSSQYTWDFKARLSAVEDEALRAQYVYDYAGRRVLKQIRKRNAEGGFETAPSKTTLYLDKYFEVDESGQGTKYVFFGNRRVASVTGMLNPPAERVQRFRVFPGWNLLSLSVEATDALDQMGLGSDASIQAVFQYIPATRQYAPLDSGDTLPKGSIFWLYAADNAVLEVRGAYADPVDVPLSAGDGYVAPQTLDALSAAEALPEDAERILVFDALAGTWRKRLAGPANALSDLPPFIRPGDPMYLSLTGNASIKFASPASRIRYYSQDHTGSSGLVTDGNGSVLEELTYYPFGQPRNHFVAGTGTVARYTFAQKERDQESGLCYFGARYLATPLGSFLSPDPVSTLSPDRVLPIPQSLNPYAYALRNPLAYTDANGESWSDLGSGFIDQAKGIGMYAGMSLLQGQNPDVPWAALGKNAASQVLAESESSLKTLRKQGAGAHVGAVAGLVAVRSTEKILAEDGGGAWGKIIATTAASTVLGDLAQTLGITEVFEAGSAAEAMHSVVNVGRRAMGKLTDEITGALAGLGGDSPVGKVIGAVLGKALDMVLDKALDAAFEWIQGGLDKAMDSEFGKVAEEGFQLGRQGVAEER
jgi:RHS repeat-associated protein